MVVRTASKSALKIDELDLNTDKVSDLLKKLPSWFGPARPCDFVLGGQKLLNEEEVLAEQGVTLGATINMFKRGKWNEEL